MPVDDEKTVKEKLGAKETNLVKEAALLKELVRSSPKEAFPKKLANPAKASFTMSERNLARAMGPVKTRVPAVQPKVIFPVKKGQVAKVGSDVTAASAAAEKNVVKKKVVDCTLEENVAKMKIVVKDCSCMRPVKLIMCTDCGVTFTGRVQTKCSTHPR